MKCGYHIIENLGIVLIHKKKCNSVELKTLIQEIVQNPFFKSDFNVILDLRNTEFRLTFDDIKSCGSYLKSYLPLGETNKLAIITQSSEQTKKAVDLLLCYNGKPKCQVFSDLERAFNWMNLSSTDFRVKMRLNHLRHQESYFHH